MALNLVPSAEMKAISFLDSSKSTRLPKLPGSPTSNLHFLSCLVTQKTQAKPNQTKPFKFILLSFLFCVLSSAGPRSFFVWRCSVIMECPKSFFFLFWGKKLNFVASFWVSLLSFFLLYKNLQLLNFLLI